MVVAQTSVEELGGTPRQFETDSSIAREPLDMGKPTTP